MSASHHGLDNLIAIVDFNNQQADGPSHKMLCSETLEAKWSAFGWLVQRVDGNDIHAVAKALQTARNKVGVQPRVIICDTRMAKGVPFLEAREKNHFLRVEPDEWDLAIEALDEGFQAWDFPSTNRGSWSPRGNGSAHPP